MADAERSLRAMVEHWLAPDPSGRVRVKRFSHRRTAQARYVCVETVRTGQLVEMFFFRHGDGTWHVFPPPRERPAMRVAGQYAYL
ncbi:hypothetical protein VOI32_39640 [Paraburkholderia caribensis]|uniref:Uncharacterized protein n=2 Tax=Paraburkholderia TaxID=1822464 RepID=B2JXP6_PARP8|nr:MULTISPECIES: hypothetical protein [Paraburkholderia]ACC76404.1 conserved hypothetical protein [Paraburkholderia phymatum STM815]MCO4882866.1 hypothetical protein [Paraburkholderia caribensis]PTB23680.1 hypothetical protein C9I56_38035 [Paraburkholderia caribensis]